jgi:CheY-like chemotaxis protein
LPQVYGFAQQSGGRVTIDSAVGVGTTVTLMLPRSQHSPIAESRSQEEAPGAIAPNRRGSALLVEDDREVSALAREMLSSLGFAVTHVASADAALGALADSRTVDVVLSDVMMPGGVTGLELAREIRRRYSDLPVILTTGYVESLSDMGDGEFGLLLKPYTLEGLAAALGVEVK